MGAPPKIRTATVSRRRRPDSFRGIVRGDEPPDTDPDPPFADPTPADEPPGSSVPGRADPPGPVDGTPC
ncbi:hypothetical protein GCM10009760_57920 [Kitasatospora kazusensis]|uniref:Uncharacterized protein n=1 Tax=Kitasatospora kazusensis TaxID=407974 RepID=A0ABN3A9X1_9ACTN